MEHETLIDVVIITWNDGLLLQRAIDSVHASTHVHTRCIVVDNGSTPLAEPALRDHDLLVRLPENRGVAGGRNAGIRHGTARYVCLLDSDAVLHRNALHQLAIVLDSDESVALAAPVFDDQDPGQSGGRAPTLGRKVARALGRTASYVDGVREGDLIYVDFAIGACQMFRRSAYDEVGGLDERYFYGPEDVDFCMRLRSHGWSVVQATRAQCEHPPRRSHRKMLTVRGVRHAAAVARFLWRHRSFDSDLAAHVP